MLHETSIPEISGVDAPNLPELRLPEGLSDVHFELQETITDNPVHVNRFPLVTITGLSRLNSSQIQIDIGAAGDGPHNNSLSFDIVPGTVDSI